MSNLFNPITLLLIGVCIIVLIRLLMVSSCLIMSQFLFIKELDIFRKKLSDKKKNDS